MALPRPVVLALGSTSGVLALLGVYATGVRLTTGSWGPLVYPERWAVEAWLGVVFGVAVAAAASAARLTARDLHTLSPVLELRDAAAAIDAATQVRGRGFYLFTAALALLAFGGTLVGLDPINLPGSLRGDAALLEPWACVRNGVLFATLGGAAWIETALSFRAGRLVEEHASLDLLDRSRYAPLGRRARRNVLCWAFLSVFSTFLLVVVAATVVLPVRGLKQRLERDRRDRLERIRSQIRVRGESLLEGKVDPGPALADLVAYEQRIADASTWAYETSTLVRAGLYALVGAASWVGAALVERGLDLLVR